MNQPRVSVIMPTYNCARYIAEAIESVLGQTMPSWELIIVDDGSADTTAEVVARFDDPRIRYVRQAKAGASRARNTGLALAGAAYLAFIDADDAYHPEKLAVQAGYLDQHADVGLAYVSRIEIDQHGNRVNLARLPDETTLPTVVLGIPFAPTDCMVRRGWIERVGNFSEAFVVNEDRHLYIRLVLDGCRCVGIERFLAYRRLDTARRVDDLPARLDDMLRSLDAAFQDPRCPGEVRALTDAAHRNIFLACAYQAAMQNEASLAQAWFRDAVRLGPSILDDNAEVVLQEVSHVATRDGGDHEARLGLFFRHLPPEFEWLGRHRDWVVARGYLLRGARDIMWGRCDAGRAHLELALRRGARVDERVLQTVVDQLLNYELAVGTTAAEIAVLSLCRELRHAAGGGPARRLQGRVLVNRAFAQYRRGEYAKVVPNAAAAMVTDPSYVTNRGAVSILVRSLAKVLGRQFHRRDTSAALADKPPCP